MKLKSTEPSNIKLRKKGTGITIVLVILVAISIAALIGKVLGLKMYAVTSSSMKPALNVGDVVLTAPGKFEDFKEGDIITFYINKDLQTATHRIIAINEKSQTFTTKGDSNDAADGSPVLYGNVVGEVLISVPYLGYALMYISTFQGKVTVGAVLLIFIILLFLWDDSDKEKKLVQTDNDLKC